MKKWRNIEDREQILCPECGEDNLIIYDEDEDEFKWMCQVCEKTYTSNKEATILR